MTETAAPILSVIILNWNGAQFLPRCYESLRAQTLRNMQVLLADNGSTDESISLTRTDYPEVEVVALGQNLGYAEANNRAAVLSRARYLLFLNNDTHLHPEALAALVAAAEGRPHIPIWAPQQRTYDGSELLHIGSGVDVMGFPCIDTGKRVKAFYADGAAFFIRRDVFLRLGGFDPRYFIFFEETDLCWRAQLQGYQIGTVADAIVFHQAGGTVGSSLAGNEQYVTSKNKRRWAHRNQLTTMLKNYSTPALCVVLPLFALLTAAEVGLLIVTGQRSAVKESYLAAWRDVLRNRHHIRAMRQRVQASRTVSDWDIVRRMEWRLATVSLFFRIGVPAVK